MPDPADRLEDAGSMGDTTTYVKLDSSGRTRASASCRACRWNGLPDCAGAAPMNRPKRALSQSGLPCGMPFRSPRAAPAPTRKLCPQYDP
ncbi:hypothetical protein D3C72_2155400 [compost metagenome]